MATERISKEMEAETKERTDLHILVIGRTGSGKSTLINAMLDDILAQQSHGASPTKHNTVEPHRLTLGSVEVIIYDTPGFLDRRQSTEELLSEIKKEEPSFGFDLIILCHRLIDRFDEVAAELIGTLCRHRLGVSEGTIRKPYIVALTFANFFLEFNEVNDLKYPEAKKELIIRKIKDFKTHFNEASRDKASNESNAFFDEIPFIVTGRRGQRALPNTSDWMNDLWRACYQQSSNKTKPLINSLTFQLASDHYTAKCTGTGLGAAMGLIASTGPIVPEIGLAIKSAIEPRRRMLFPVKQSSTSECKTDEEELGRQKVTQAKPITPLPSVKPEQLSTEIFKELGIR